MFISPPPFAGFQHVGVRDGFESTCFRTPEKADDGYVLEGGTAAVEDDLAWSVQYRIAVDQNWHTTRVEATGTSLGGFQSLLAERRDGRWKINETERPELDDCIDIDFESSLVTNTLAVHRIDLSATTPQSVPTAFVRANDLRVERVEQTYLCIDRTERRIHIDYQSATFQFGGRLVFDDAGLIIDYPGIGRRHR
jgi:hypothetical protein